MQSLSLNSRHEVEYAVYCAYLAVLQPFITTEGLFSRLVKYVYEELQNHIKVKGL